jgi:hypothetical protein
VAGTTHLQLLIEVDSDPITGSVSNGDAVEQRFTGWIELVAVLEAARTGGPISDPQPPVRERGEKTLGSLPGAKGSRR